MTAEELLNQANEFLAVEPQSDEEFLELLERAWECWHYAKISLTTQPDSHNLPPSPRRDS